MNYKKKYESALKKAKSAIENCGYNQGHIAMIESIFPELKESEDEKIRKRIYNYIKTTLEDYEPEKEKWLAWLKKLEVFAKHGDGMYYLHNNDFTYIGGNQTSDVEQEVKNTFHRTSPKFSKGDWIVFNGLTLLVNQVFQDYYRTVSIDGFYNSYDRTIDNAARLWTLKDAKDGDILVVNNRPFIFKGFLDSGHPDYPVAYGGICTLDTFISNNDNIWWDNNKEDMKPATKEERKLLFQRMKEDGYEWDSDTKELKKLL